jgi:hypothetical protein
MVKSQSLNKGRSEMIKKWRLNPKYIVARIKNLYYFKKNQNLPWMTKHANEFLMSNLKKDMTLLEFGSGRSTNFYAEKVNKVFSREHNKEWHNIVTLQLLGYKNVDYKFYDDLNEYSNIDDIKDNSLDVVVVDGRNRVNCLLNSIPKLKIGGLLVLDNAERYLIYKTSSPAKYVVNKRDEKWLKAEKKLENLFWRIDTTDGVSDTILFIKRN